VLGVSAGRWPGGGTSVRFRFEAPNHAVGLVARTWESGAERGARLLNRIGEPACTALFRTLMPVT
jgi:hypothetical protein